MMASLMYKFQQSGYAKYFGSFLKSRHSVQTNCSVMGSMALYLGVHSLFHQYINLLCNLVLALTM